MGWGRGTWMEEFLVWRKRTLIDNYFFFMHLRHILTAACVLESNKLENVLRFPGTKNAELQRVWKFLPGIVFWGPQQCLWQSVMCFIAWNYVSNSDFDPSCTSLSRQSAGVLARGSNDLKVLNISLAVFLELQTNSRLCLCCWRLFSKFLTR